MAGVQLQLLAGTAFSLLILSLGFPSCLSWERPSRASDSISLGKTLSGNQTLVSKGGRFELGFFTSGNSHYYLGIWYKNIPVQTVIWVANREAPLASTASSELKISLENGNLILLSRSKAPVWSSNITSPKSKSTLAVLLDTGNLVLKESPGSSSLIWQSFDHPTDTWVPGQFVGMNKVTGEYQVLTSWKNSQDPAPGWFSHRLDPGGSNDYLTLWNGSVVYDHTGEWNGHSFGLIPQATLNVNFKFSFIETRERKYVTCTMSNDSMLLRLVMDVTGQLKTFTWLDADQKWMLMWSRPAAQCDVYSICGAFGVCDQKGLPPCGCLPGFEPKSLGGWDLDDWSGGCVRRSPLECSDNASSVGSQADVFSVMPDVKFPTSSQTSAASAEECKLACSHNCSCSAFAYDVTCLIWNGHLHNLQQLSVADGSGGTLYLRLAASEQPHSETDHKTKMLLLSILGPILGFFILSSISLLMATYGLHRRPSAAMVEAVDGSLFQFRYIELQQITNNFSTLLGRGGFGSVFAGVLSDSTPVAVKRLEGPRQGEKQFRAEVRTLGTVQHANLVRLRGFCADGDKRLLVYDCMPNGSLDSHLFKGEPPCLEWRTRYHVALGTARGLAYLHEECRERIIHCDIKPENILLDESFQPKVADFGLAKLVARDFSRVLTTVRGTIGYLAPEWVSGLAITPKADVYSFGMVLFELISGRRNRKMGGGGGESAAYLPLLAAQEINGGGDVLRLLDHNLGADADVEELTRACIAACWCIQDEERCRPTMREVVRILEGVLVAGLPPIPRSLQCLVEYGDYSDSL